MSSKPKISFYGLWPELQKYTRSKLGGLSCSLHAEKISTDNLDPKTETLAVFVEAPVNKQILTKLPKLKMIAAMSTGYDHIDLKECKKRKIVVSNVPSYGENTVAEHALALMLGLTRKLFQSVKRVKEGIYDFHGLRGTDLKGKTLGVIGTGRIGAHLIRMAQGFEMKIIAYDKFPNKKLTSDLKFSYTTLPRLLAQSDIISLHTPLLKETRHLINKKNIKQIKPGAYIINTARGALIDPEALVWGLQSGHLAGAGLDVLEDEQLIQEEDKLLTCPDCQIRTSLMNNILIDHPNTIITPHNAFNSAEALQRIVDVTVENIKGFIKGKVQNVVNK